MSPSDENANRRRGVMCFVLFLIFVFLSFFIKDTTKNDESVRAKYWFSNEQNSISAFRQCDATDEFMYFTYQNNISRVEVYDGNGLFQYTICFEDWQNGQIYLRCENEKMFLKLRNDNVFVFSGEELLASFTKAEADERGYTNEWFQNAESKMQIEDDYILLLNQEGEPYKQVERPVSIITSARTPAQQYKRVMFSACVGLFMLIVPFGRIILKKAKKYGKEHPIKCNRSPKN